MIQVNQNVFLFPILPQHFGFFLHCNIHQTVPSLYYCQTEDLFIFHKIGDKRNRFIFQSQSFLTVIKFFTGSNIGFQKCYSDHLPAFLNFKCMVYGQFGLYLHTEYWLFVENII